MESGGYDPSNRFVPPDFKRRQLLFDSFSKLQQKALGDGSSSSASAPSASSAKTSASTSASTSTSTSAFVQQDGAKGTLLYSWGAGYHGQLGLNTARKKCRLVPSCIDFHEPVQMVACGGFHTAVLTDDGRVYSWGDGRLGQLGNLARKHNMHSTPRLVDYLISYKVTVSYIACGQYHTAAVSTVGRLFTWGSGKWGQLGHSVRQDERFPRKVECDKSLGNFVKVACGDRHTVVLNDNGQVVTFGNGQHGQLGHGNGLDQLRPTLLTNPAISQHKVVQVDAGATTTAVVTSTGLLYIWGFGESIHPKGVSNVLESPRQVKMKESVKQVACGLGHVLVLTDAGDVYTFGVAGMGQLGHGSKSNVRTPRLVLRGKEIQQVAAGRYHSMAVTGYGVVYSWGCGESGQLGNDSLESELLPGIVINLLPNVVGHISCGEHHSLALTSISHSAISSDVQNWRLIEESEYKIKERMLKDVPNGLKTKHILQIEQERRNIIRQLAESLKREREEKQRAAQEKMAMIQNPDEVMCELQNAHSRRLADGFDDDQQMNMTDRDIGAQLTSQAMDAMARRIASGAELVEMKENMNNDSNDLDDADDAQTKKRRNRRLQQMRDLASHPTSSSVSRVMSPARTPLGMSPREPSTASSHHHATSSTMSGGAAADAAALASALQAGGGTGGEEKEFHPSLPSAALSALPLSDGVGSARPTSVPSGRVRLAPMRPGTGGSVSSGVPGSAGSFLNPLDATAGGAGAPGAPGAGAAAGGGLLTSPSAFGTSAHTQLVPLSSSTSQPHLPGGDLRPSGLGAKSGGAGAAVGAGAGAGTAPSGSSTTIMARTASTPTLAPISDMGFAPLAPRIAFIETTTKTLQRVRSFMTSTVIPNEDNYMQELLKTKKEYNQLKSERKRLEALAKEIKHELEFCRPNSEEEMSMAMQLENVKQLNMKLVTLNTRLMEAEENKKNYELYIIRMKEEDLQLGKQIDHLRSICAEYERLLQKLEKMNRRVGHQRIEVVEETTNFLDDVKHFMSFAENVVRDYRRVLNASYRQSLYQEQLFEQRQQRQDEKRLIKINELKHELAEIQNTQNDTKAAIEGWEDKVEYYEKRFRKIAAATGLTRADHIISKFYFNDEITRDLQLEVQRKEEELQGLRDRKSSLLSQLEASKEGVSVRKWKDISAMEETLAESKLRLDRAQEEHEKWTQRLTQVVEGIMQLSKNIAVAMRVEIDDEREDERELQRERQTAFAASMAVSAAAAARAAAAAAAAAANDASGDADGASSSWNALPLGGITSGDSAFAYSSGDQPAVSIDLTDLSSGYAHLDEDAAAQGATGAGIGADATTDGADAFGASDDAGTSADGATAAAVDPATFLSADGSAFDATMYGLDSANNEDATSNDYAYDGTRMHLPPGIVLPSTQNHADDEDEEDEDEDGVIKLVGLDDTDGDMAIVTAKSIAAYSTPDVSAFAPPAPTTVPRPATTVMPASVDPLSAATGWSAEGVKRVEQRLLSHLAKLMQCVEAGSAASAARAQRRLEAEERERELQQLAFREGQLNELFGNGSKNIWQSIRDRVDEAGINERDLENMENSVLS